MRILYTDYFKKRLKKRIQKAPQIQSKIAKQLKLLQQNIRHPSLKTHNLKGNRTNQYAIWIEGDVRITFVIVKDGLLLTDIITHDEY